MYFGIYLSELSDLDFWSLKGRGKKSLKEAWTGIWHYAESIVNDVEFIESGHLVWFVNCFSMLHIKAFATNGPRGEPVATSDVFVKNPWNWNSWFLVETSKGDLHKKIKNWDQRSPFPESRKNYNLRPPPFSKTRTWVIFNLKLKSKTGDIFAAQIVCFWRSEELTWFPFSWRIFDISFPFPNGFWGGHADKTPNIKSSLKGLIESKC